MNRLLTVVLLLAGCADSSVSRGQAEDCGSAGRCELLCSRAPAACFWAGAFFQDGRSGPDDAERAVKLFRRGCDGKDLRACRALATSYRRGLGVTRDVDKADQLFAETATAAQSACDKGEAMGCAVRGALLEWGRGVAVDKDQARALYVRAAELFEKSCTNGATWACLEGARILLSVRGEDASARKERRRKLNRLACDKNEPLGCYYLARALADESEGKATDADELFARAEKGLRAACERNNISRCLVLYRMLESRSRKRGLKMMLDAVAVADKVCRLGAAWSCERVATMLRRGCSSRRQCTGAERRDLERRAFGARLRVITMNETRCRAGKLSGCEGLAREMMPSSGSGPKDLKEPARELYDRLCSAGRANACYRLSSSYRYSALYSEQAKGLAYLEKGCALGDGFSCDRAAEAYREGKYVLRDEVRAQELAHKACQADSYYCKDKSARRKVP
jgi:TPR repeat protein